MKHIPILSIIFLLMSCTGEIAQKEKIETPTPTNEIIKIEAMNTDKKEEIIVTEKVEDNCFVYDDFSASSNNNWLIVNDGVMGGKSIGKYTLQDSIFTFSGSINTNGGGFTSIRAGLGASILSEYNSIKLKAKSDNRSYQITFRDNNRRGISHRAILPFQSNGEFEEINIVIDDLESVYFGRRVDAAPFDKENAREIGFIISDGIDGDFSIEIDSIQFCK